MAVCRREAQWESRLPEWSRARRDVLHWPESPGPDRLAYPEIFSSLYLDISPTLSKYSLFLLNTSSPVEQ